MTESTDPATAVVRAFIYQTGQGVEIKRGTLPEIIGAYEGSANAFVVARPGSPRSLDFFLTAGVAGERTDQGFAIGVGAAGQLAVTLEDGTLVIVYAPAAWLEYTAG